MKTKMRSFSERMLLSPGCCTMQAGIWIYWECNRGCISLKVKSAHSSVQAARCVTCGSAPTYRLWGFSLWAPARLPQGFVGSLKGWFYPTRWSGQWPSDGSARHPADQLHAPASTGGSPHSTLSGVNYTLKSRAAIIRTSTLRKKLRNSHDLHCSRWINRPWIELWKHL